MKPRLYYTLLSIVSVAIVMFSGITASYLFSIIFFWLRVQTADTMAYGARANLSNSIASFPWHTLMLAILLLTLSVVLVRRYGKMYKHKASTVAAILITCSVLLGIGLSFLSTGYQRTQNQPSGRGRYLEQ